VPAITISNSVGHGATNKAADVKKIKQRLIDLGFGWLTADSVVGPETVNAIKLFQAIKNGFQTVDRPQNDGRVDPDGLTLAWMNARNAPQWVSMPKGSPAEGFFNAELADTSDNHDFGVSWLEETLRAAAAVYRASHIAANPRAALLTFNDFSQPRGGPTPDHATHQTGLCCDLLLARKDGKAGGISFTDPKYDRAATRSQIQALLAQPLALRVLFNDPVLASEGLCIEVDGHHHHLHFDIKPPARLA
jgi:peptidoglycan hydrolase-like protein with peptidoglycan-binding domain